MSSKLKDMIRKQLSGGSGGSGGSSGSSGGKRVSSSSSRRAKRRKPDDMEEIGEQIRKLVKEIYICNVDMYETNLDSVDNKIIYNKTKSLMKKITKEKETVQKVFTDLSKELKNAREKKKKRIINKQNACVLDSKRYLKKRFPVNPNYRLFDALIGGEIPLTQRVCVDQHPYFKNNLLLYAMAKKVDWDFIVRVKECYGNCIYYRNGNNRHALYYLFNYPEHDREILLWYRQTKHVIYENGLLGHILRDKPSPGMLDTIFEWHREINGTNQPAATITNQPNDQMDEDEFGFYFYGLQVSFGSLVLRQQQKQWLLQQHSSRKSNEIGERFTDYDVDICKDVVNNHSPDVTENNIFNFLNKQLISWKNEINTFVKMDIVNMVFDHWCVADCHFKSSVPIHNVEHEWTLGYEYSSQYEEFRLKQNTGLVLMRVSVLQMLIIHMAPIGTILHALNYVSKENPNAKWLWRYSSVFNHNICSGGFDGPNISRGLLNVSTDLLIRDRLQYTGETQNQSWNQLLQYRDDTAPNDLPLYRQFQA